MACGGNRQSGNSTLRSRSARLSLALGLCVCFSANSQQTVPTLDQDPHYTPAGFFDLHVCNWPEQEPFYMALFSSTEFDQIASITVLDSARHAVGNLDMQRFQIQKNPGKAEKHVFITHFSIPAEVDDGWFSAVVTMRSGQQYEAKDFVVHAVLPLAHDFVPIPDAELENPPEQLRWGPVRGATHYMVTIRDDWDNDQLIYRSPLITEPKLTLPVGLIRPGGHYQWRVHARDVNGSTLLGDFNHGSLTAPVRFSVAPQ